MYSLPTEIINKGLSRIVMSKPIKDPITVSLTASYPLPSFSNWCPGRTDKAVSASGAPKYIEGIAFKKVWEIAKEIIKIDKIKGEV